ncbi:MAG: hypothetical protein ACLS8R_03440 [Anaeromassilibacillus sp.]
MRAYTSSWGRTDPENLCRTTTAGAAFPACGFLNRRRVPHPRHHPFLCMAADNNSTAIAMQYNDPITD